MITQGYAENEEEAFTYSDPKTNGVISREVS